jgi:hypothetical protein
VDAAPSRDTRAAASPRLKVGGRGREALARPAPYAAVALLPAGPAFTEEGWKLSET